MAIKKILVPLDFSTNSEIALDYAIQFAEKFNASITLFHAIVIFQYDFNDDEKLSSYEEIIKSHSATIQDNLNDNKAGISARGIEVHTTAERGISATDIILNYIEKNDYDLVIMGTLGKTGLKHLLQGSTAEKVVRLSPSPVLTVHADYDHFALDHILVPVDFSDSSQKAIKHAVDLQNSSNARITCLHIVERQVHPAYYAGGSNSVFKFDADMKTRVLDNLKIFAEKAGGISNIDFTILEGISYQEIVNFARQNNVDLIVIATRGLTGLEYMLMGSTTEKVVRLTNIPVITFKE